MNEKGFTLIELLISVVILGLTAVSLMALFPNGYKQITKAGHMSVIDHLGHQKIDELKAKGYGNADLAAGTHPLLSNQYRLTGQDFAGYSVKWTVTDNSPITNVKTVVVEVGYWAYQLDGTPISASRQFQLKEYFVTYISQ